MPRLSESSAIALIVLGLAAAAPANALTNRAWVSGHGVDSANCGSTVTPCRTLQYTHDHIVAAGGQVQVLDPAGYGPVTITKALSIVNEGVGVVVIGAAAAGNGVTVQAGAGDVVTLRGLTIVGSAAANYGVEFDSGGMLQISDCHIHDFTKATIGSGVFVDVFAASSFVIAQSEFAGNTIGVWLQPQGPGSFRGVITGARLTANGRGLQVGDASSTATNQYLDVVDSVIAGNQYGILGGDTGAVEIAVRDSDISANVIGLWDIGATFRLSRTQLHGNAQFGYDISAGVIYSAGDNAAHGNGGFINGNGGNLTPDTMQ